MTGTMEQELAAAQRARFDASIAADGPALERLIADDLMYFHTTGRQDTKRTFIDSVVESKRYIAFNVTDQTVRALSDDIGIVTAIVDIVLTAPDGQRTLHARCTSTWARRDGRLQETFWQSTLATD